MNKSNWLVISVAAALTAGGLILFKTQAAEPSVNQASPHRQWLQRARERLGLTDEQVAQIKTELQGEVATVKDMIASLHDALEGRSVKEICERTGSSAVAVRVRAVRARAKLRRALERLEKGGK
jgi:Sigma-70, region 4